MKQENTIITSKSPKPQVLSVPIIANDNTLTRGSTNPHAYKFNSVTDERNRGRCSRFTATIPCSVQPKAQKPIAMIRKLPSLLLLAIFAACLGHGRYSKAITVNVSKASLVTSSGVIVRGNHEPSGARPSRNLGVTLRGKQEPNAVQWDICPSWTFPTTNGSCKCGSSIDGVVHCDPDTLQSSILICYCMTADENGKQNIGACSLTCPYDTSFVVPQNVSNLDSFMCGDDKRTGQLCGKCQEGYAPPAYSYQLGCVRCSDGETNVVKYLAVSLLPLTVFITIVVATGISATSARMNAIIFVCQALCYPPLLRIIVAQVELQFPSYLSGVLYTLSSVYGIWTLDFFRAVYNPFCLHHSMSTIQVLAMDYVVAIYPMFLTLLIYLMVKLYDRKFTPLVYLCKPFQWCTGGCTRRWNFRTSLIHVFATFFVLSCAKLLSVSGDLLIFTMVYDIHGQRQGGLYLYYDGTIEYFGSSHLPYAIIAITILTVFVLFPSILLCVYPFRCFQRLLNRYRARWFVLHTFMDTFQGCYKDGTNGTNDCRYFAGVYVWARIGFFVIYTLSVGTAAYAVAVLYLLVIAALVVIVKPYKIALYNIVDPLLIFTMVAAFTAYLTTAVETAYVYWVLAVAVISVAVSTPILYLAALLFHRLLVQTGMLQRLSRKLRTIVSGEYRLTAGEEESLPDRLVNAELYRGEELEAEWLQGTRSSDSDEDMLIPGSY